MNSWIEGSHLLTKGLLPSVLRRQLALLQQTSCTLLTLTYHECKKCNFIRYYKHVFFNMFVVTNEMEENFLIRNSFG